MLPMNIWDGSPLGWIGWLSLQSKGLSRGFSSTTVQKHPFLGTQLSLCQGNVISSVLSLSQQKFEATDVNAVGTSELSDSPCYSSWTDQFYLENKGKYILKAWGYANPKDPKRREREKEYALVGERDPQPLAPLFMFVFPLPLALPCVNWASQECCWFQLRSSPGPSFVLFSRAFPFLVVWPPPFWTPFFPILTP